MKFEEAIAKLRDEGRPGDALVDEDNSRLFYMNEGKCVCTANNLYTEKDAWGSGLLNDFIKKDYAYAHAEPEYMNLQTAIRKCTIDDIICNADDQTLKVCPSTRGRVRFFDNDCEAAFVDPDILFNDRWYVE